jgi:CDP-glucose 4,6-dehydratase
MVDFATLRPYYEGKKVFLTGHTGFKGTWMLQVLNRLGAVVKGFSLPPQHSSDLYNLVLGDELCHSSILHDIRDADRVRKEILHFEPDFIFHLAAQPLVLQGYEEPLYTFEVNTQGTANVLDALRFLNNDCASVIITTDKVYENKEGGRAFQEDDKLGGYDPYSASKAACEIVISSYRSSYFQKGANLTHLKPVASVRAGNVIGGGDFAENRIIPDIIKSISSGQKISLRNPHSTRPWQHVLEPIGVYLLLGTRLIDNPYEYDQAYNIGPKPNDGLTVEELTQIAIERAGRGSYEVAQLANAPHEAKTLSLDIEKVKKVLGWTPKYDSREAICKTIDWYMDAAHADVKCQTQINDYFNASIQHAEDN